MRQRSLKQKRSRRVIASLIWTLLALVLACVILVVATSLIMADRLLKAPSDPIPAYATNVLPPFASVRFESSDHVTLAGWYIRAQQEVARGTVITVHQQGANRLPFGLASTTLIRTLSKAGFHVLAFDLRHAGESGGELSSFGYNEADDVAAAIQFAAGRAPSSPIILYGLGTGTTAIFRALNDDPTLLRQHVAGLMLDTPARSSDAFVAAHADERSSWMFWLPKTTPTAVRISGGHREAMDFFSSVTTMTVPMLWIGHARDARLAPRDVAPMLHERLRLHPDLTQTFLLPGEGHLDAYETAPDAYIDAVMTFLDARFPSE
ncbi:MAG: alpha/beta hydrolase [Saccharofermentanales bacterium]